MSNRPLFVSFEGIDGCGKSTLMEWLSSQLEERGISHLKTHEPGGTLLGEAIRGLLLDSAFPEMDSWAETLLYAASRAQHVEEVVRPALQRGLWVLTDRYADATLAYQGYGRNLDLARLKALHDWSTGGLWPDCTVLLDCDVAAAWERMRSRGGKADRLERQDRSFHERVRGGYLKLAEAEAERFVILDANLPLHDVMENFRILFRQRRLSDALES